MHKALVTAVKERDAAVKERDGEDGVWAAAWAKALSEMQQRMIDSRRKPAHATLTSLSGAGIGPRLA